MRLLLFTTTSLHFDKQNLSRSIFKIFMGGKKKECCGCSSRSLQPFFLSHCERNKVPNEVRFLRIMRLAVKPRILRSKQFFFCGQKVLPEVAFCGVHFLRGASASIFSSTFCSCMLRHLGSRALKKLLPKTDYVSFACQERTSLFDKYDVE